MLKTNNTLATHAYQFVLSNVQTFSPTLVNDFRFGYNRLINGVLQHDAYTGVNEVGALGGFAGVAAPYPAIYGVPCNRARRCVELGRLLRDPLPDLGQHLPVG